MMILKKKIWLEADATYLAGHLWYQNELLELNQLNSLIASCNDFSEFTRLAKQFSGQYTVIFNVNNKRWIASDTIGRYPLFYCKSNNQFILTDSPKELLAYTSLKENTYSALYFKQFGTTPKFHSLVENIIPIEAGCIVEVSEEIQIIENNKNLFQQPKLQPEYSKTELADLLNTIFEKYLLPFKNNPIAIPLTAGYDSRLILSQLKLRGFENVYCFTWGRKGNKEYQAAKTIAEKFGYRYQFIEYDEVLISKYLHGEVFCRYIDYVGNLTSMPFLQDYFAIRFLKEHGIVPENTVFIQGHTGDGYAGSHLKPWLTSKNRNQIANEIIDQFGTTHLQNCKKKKAIQAMLQNDFGRKEAGSIQDFDYWDLNVRQAKFIAHSASVFEFFGFNSVLPLSDKQFIKYFFNAPFSVRLGEKLYRETLERFYFKPLDILDPIKTATNLKKEAVLKSILKKLTPFGIKGLYYNGEDAIFYKEITKKLIESNRGYERPKSPVKFNSYIIQWYLKNIFHTK